jgi:hypothetical protein
VCLLKNKLTCFGRKHMRTEATNQTDQRKQEDTPAFVGWHRPGPFWPWQRLVAAATYDAAWAALLGEVRGGDKVVLRSGEHPARKRLPYQR